ncbi:tyrosine-protein phosphatase non-receptor type 2 isoform X2 [Latimeria chalumnae]|uniref:tyrosine-protein phosphatase non-receptor type 2 isoform X2 n=1 Tax=Latimeria chalumnae TaxID=7897 RepID=UPI0003C15973
MEREFEEIDSAGRWPSFYLEIRNQSQDYPCKVARNAENRSRNRYRDVNPFDHSRVILKSTENDYINASLVAIAETQRNYILSQGPLPSTCGHFWLMVWEQQSRAVVMLNRVIEKESVKCAQYWPTEEGKKQDFEDTGFCLTLISEDVKSYYTVRLLELENLKTKEKREIYHFHYTTWPDFGVPESPASFLNFLFKVRESGSLNPEHGAAVVHCSAGIGRSGTFLLVDTCLLLLEKRKDPSSVDIKKVLLDLRKYRMGLIQTPDQLRFSYMAIIEGAKYIMGDSSVQVAAASFLIASTISVSKQWKELSKEDQAPPPEHFPPPQPPKRVIDRCNGTRVPCLEDKDSTTERKTTGTEVSLRKRQREDRKANTAQKVEQMKKKLSETERKRKRWLSWKPILINIGAVSTVIVAVVGVICWRTYFYGNAM